MTGRIPTTTLRQDALAIFRAALDAADPAKAVHRFLTVHGSTLFIGGQGEVHLNDFRRIIVVGAGKGSAVMARALEEILEDRIDGGLISVKYGHATALRSIAVAEAGHPVPDQSGLQASGRITAILGEADEHDLVFAVISGGGSALLPAPAEGITLEDKQELTRRLLAVGADIQEINAIRKHISLTKGGQLMRLAYPSFVVNLVLSDVVGDDPGTIASGPFVPDVSTFDVCLGLIHRYGLGSACPETILARLRQGAEGKIPETPKPGDPIFTRLRSVIVGSNPLSLAGAAEKARALGYRPIILSSSIDGETHEAARFHAAVAREIRSTGNPVPAPACLLSGGETTVVVKGEGTGGRNQELALSLVRAAGEIPDAVFLCAGTDGTDGPTDAAGAVVDSTSWARARAAGLEPEVFLAANDSYRFFAALNDLVITGPTGTNVMDVRVILVG